MYQIDSYITEDKFTLGASAAPESRIRTKFDYGVRQRRGQRGLITYSVRLVLNHYFTQKFMDFWEDTKEGTDKFLVNQEIHAKRGNHTVRFTQPYTMNTLGGDLYEITTSLEVVQFGDALMLCPLYPSNILYPSNLYPC